MIRVLAALAMIATAPLASSAPVLGIDHMPVAVADLELAERRFETLGFTLKPGRLHANGIRNAHAKFADGSYIELITAPAARDPLTARYRALITVGDGPAFLAMLAPDPTALAAALKPFGPRIENDDGAPGFRTGDARDYLFFGAGGSSPTDRPEHFIHRNGARGIAAIWLAPRDQTETIRDFTALGARMGTARHCTPGCGPATQLTFANNAVIVLPSGRARLPGRPIIGATIMVDSLSQAAAAMTAGGVSRARIVARGRGLLVPPDLANGLWLEFREAPGGPAR